VTVTAHLRSFASAGAAANSGRGSSASALRHFNLDEYAGEREPALHHRLAHCLEPPSDGAGYLLVEVAVAKPPFVPPYLLVDVCAKPRSVQIY
jgi:hypothetical protein